MVIHETVDGRVHYGTVFQVEKGQVTCIYRASSGWAAGRGREWGQKEKIFYSIFFHGTVFVSTDLDECAFKPCSEQGTASCKDLPNAYSCVCLDGYTGQNCEAGKIINQFHSALITNHILLRWKVFYFDGDNLLFSKFVLVWFTYSCAYYCADVPQKGETIAECLTKWSCIVQTKTVSHSISVFEKHSDLGMSHLGLQGQDYEVNNPDVFGLWQNWPGSSTLHYMCAK